MLEYIIQFSRCIRLNYQATGTRVSNNNTNSNSITLLSPPAGKVQSFKFSFEANNNTYNLCKSFMQIIYKTNYANDLCK